MKFHPAHIAKSSWPYLALLTAHLVWGVNFVAAKLTLTEIPAMSLAFSRFFIALLLLLPFLWVERKKIKVKLADLPLLFIAGSLTITLSITLFYAGISRTTATDASVLSLNVPILSVLIGWWILKEKVYIINLVGIVFALVGAILVIGLPSILVSGKPLSSERLVGDLLIVLGGLSWVAGAILTKKLLKEYSSLSLTAILFLVGTVSFSYPALREYLADPQWIYKVTYIGFTGLAYIVVASSIAAFFLYEWGLHKAGIIKANLFQYIEPLIATTLAVFILSEDISYSFIIGSILIGLGVYWGTIGKKFHHHHRAHRH